jgi:hypothetical protein
LEEEHQNVNHDRDDVGVDRSSNVSNISLQGCNANMCGNGEVGIEDMGTMEVAGAAAATARSNNARELNSNGSSAGGGVSGKNLYTDEQVSAETDVGAYVAATAYLVLLLSLVFGVANPSLSPSPSIFCPVVRRNIKCMRFSNQT